MSEFPPTTGVAPDPETKSQKELAADLRNTIVDIQSKLFDKSAAYYNLIMVGGYAGAFAVWGYTKSALTHKANVLTALLLGFSLAVFIFFEVYKMAKSIIHYNRVRSLLNESLPLTEFFERFNDLQSRDARRTLQSGTASSALCLIICTLASLSAIAILFYNFLAVLIDWPLWPSDGLSEACTASACSVG